MIATNRVTAFAVMLSLACTILYTIATEVNLPLVTYHPVVGELDALWRPARSGPAMYWYGWMLTAFLGAAVLAVMATFIPEAWLQRVIFFGAVGAAAYLAVSSLALYAYEQASVELEVLKSRWLSVAVAAALAACASYIAPPGWNRRLWLGWVWVVPCGALAVLGYYLTPYFTR